MNEFDKNNEIPASEAPDAEQPAEAVVPAAEPSEAPAPEAQPIPEVQSIPEVQPIPEVQSIPVVQSIPEVQPVPTAAPAPEVQPLPNAEAVPPVQPLPNAVTPPPVQPMQGYPQPPYPGQPPYYAPPVKKKKMSTGVRVFLLSIIIVGVVGLLVFVGYGMRLMLANSVSQGSSSSSNIVEQLPFGHGPQVPDSGESSGSEASGGESSGSTDGGALDMPVNPATPDIDVTPNSEGIAIQAQPTGEELDVSDVYDKVIESTVLVTTVSGTTGGTGTGIIATADGYIITNSHVVLNSKNVTVQVQTNDGVTHEAVVVGYDQTTDLAVLKIDGTGYTPAEFGDSNDLRMGQWVLVIGNPGGATFSGSITRGVVSGLDRAVGTYSESGMTYIQTDAAINPGNSGGPLVNLYGQVVGISSAKIVSDRYENMCFAIPITSAKSILDDLLAGGYVQGRVRFGITVSAVTELQAATYNVPLGVLIHTIAEDSSFTGTEVQVSDIITAVNGVSTPNLVSLTNALLEYAPGDTVTVSLFRPSEDGSGGTEFTVDVQLLEDKGETQ